MPTDLFSRSFCRAAMYRLLLKHSFRVVCIGLTLLHGSGADETTIIPHADPAMTLAKPAGKDAIRIDHGEPLAGAMADGRAECRAEPALPQSQTRPRHA